MIELEKKNNNCKQELEHVISSTNKKIKVLESESTNYKPEKEKLLKQIDSAQHSFQTVIQKQDDLLKQLQESKGLKHNKTY